MTVTGGFYPPNNSPMVDGNGLITPLWASFFDALTSFTSGITIPTGGEILWDGSTEPGGWLFCDGRAIPRSTYAALFGVIGTRYGAGDGFSTFNIPDRRGNFVIGATSLGTVQTGGAASVVIEATNLPTAAVNITDPGHGHAFVGTPVAGVVTDPGHVHSGGVTAASTAGALPGGVSITNTGSATTGISVQVTAAGSASVAFTGITAQLVGDNDPLTILPPYVSSGFIIKY